MGGHEMQSLAADNLGCVIGPYTSSRPLLPELPKAASLFQGGDAVARAVRLVERVVLRCQATVR
jgi:hypothetical protein